jgi:hypothetical protein
MSVLYKLTQYKEVACPNHDIKLSIFTLTETSKYSIILYIYDKLMDSYYLKQFSSEDKCVEFLQDKIKK